MDDRRDVYEHPDALLRMRARQSTVALMRPTVLDASNPASVTFKASTLQATYNLCATERFLTDPAAYVSKGTCSGVNVCGEAECRGEDTTYVYPAIRAFCGATRNGSTRHCGATVSRSSVR